MKLVTTIIALAFAFAANASEAPKTEAPKADAHAAQTAPAASAPTEATPAPEKAKKGHHAKKGGKKAEANTTK